MNETRKTGVETRARKALVRKLDRVLAGSALIAGLMLAKPARADSIELMAGNKSATVDLKASADITKKLGVFIRARPSVDYTGAFSSFGVGDLNINLSGGLDAVGEVEAFGGKVIPRAGMQYSAKAGDFSLYTLATMGLDAQPYLESLTLLSYSQVLYKTLGLLAQAEGVSDVTAAGNVSSKQRLRLGFGWKGWGAGPAADLTETGNSPKLQDGTFGWNVGGFVSKRF